MTPETLAKIHAVCFTVPRPWNSDEITALLKNENVFVVMSLNGFAMGRSTGPEVELLTIAVRPDAQGKGEGRALLAGFFESALQKSAEEAFLEVAENNIAAISLYKSFGFAKVGKRNGYYQVKNGKNIAAIVMKTDVLPTANA